MLLGAGWGMTVFDPLMKAFGGMYLFFLLPGDTGEIRSAEGENFIVLF